VHPDPKSKSFATRCIFLQAARDHEDDHTLTQKNSAAIAIDALPRLKLLAMASARARQTEQPVKVGMNVKAVWKSSSERQGAITDIRYFKPMGEE